MAQTTQSVAVGAPAGRNLSWRRQTPSIYTSGTQRAAVQIVEVLEFRDEVSAEGELRALGAGPETREMPAAGDALAIEGRRVVQGRVVANLRPEGDRLEQGRSGGNRLRD